MQTELLGRKKWKTVAAERRAQEQPDDQTADAARLNAPEIVPLGWHVASR
jgi:glycerol-3-phosphate dehydrogenase